MWLRAGMLGLVVVLVGLGPACNDEGGPYCEPGALAEALAEASPGDTIQIGACRVTASVTVRSGITLAGQGPDQSVLVAPEGRSAVTLTPAGGISVVRDLTVEANGSIGVVARGDDTQPSDRGGVRLSNVTVEATLGLGVGAEHLDSVVMTDVNVSGPVAEENAGSISPQATPEDTATHGLVLLDIGTAELTDTVVSGFAKFGVLILDSATSWQGGSASDNLATGLMVSGGTIDLENVEVCRTLQGLNLIPAYGAVFTGGAVVESNGLTVCESGGVGILHNAVTARHSGLIANDNADAAVWVQRSDSFEISGSGSELIGNRLAGVVVVDSANVTISNARIEETELATRVVDASAVEVGDGIQLAESTENILLSNLTLDNNQRVGLLLDLDGGDMSGITLSAIDADGTGDQLGVVAQNGTIPDGWDAGVTRGTAVEANDQAFSGGLGLVGLVGPNDIPVPPQLSEGGLDALVGPND